MLVKIIAVAGFFLCVLSVSYSQECPPGQYPCYDPTKCFNASQRCNEVNDCPDGEDELDCKSPFPVTCSPDSFMCKDGTCIKQSQLCNGVPDCSDYSDETDPRCNLCKINEFQCTDRRKCISIIFKCDGVSDCNDMSDEKNCTYDKCRSDEFQCASKHRCIPKLRECDGITDCRDESDEKDCPHTPSTPCLPDEFQCRSKLRCIKTLRVCDGFNDCRDGSDETSELCSPRPAVPGYLNLKAYPSNQVIKETQEVVFLCRDEGLLRSPVTWERGNGRPLPPGSVINITEGRLEMPNIHLADQGLYICRATGSAANLPGSQITVNLFVESWPVIPTAIPACAVYEATCQNGQCVPKSAICNGRPDCFDGSDERGCPDLSKGGNRTHACEPNEIQCANKRCVSIIWTCDSEDDCGDRSDENNSLCKPSPPGSVCRSDEFHCFKSSEIQCIPKAFWCDYSVDCVDGSDELGCSNVIIEKHPPRNVELNEGELFSISCKVVGIPQPIVVWRHNWGHVPSKCKSTSVEGVGTLTCPAIAVEDAGAYSCEGINNRGSTFAVDTILVVHRIAGPACQSGYFNTLARTPNECIPCFCFGATNICSSANLFIFQLPPPLYPRRIVNVRYDILRAELEIRPEPNSLESGIQVLDGSSFRIRGYTNDSLYREIYPYIALPENYLGNQLKSYGGFIKYRIRFEGGGRQVNSPDIIISGNGYNLLYLDSAYIPGREKEQSVRLIYGSWYKMSRDQYSGSDGTAPTVVATREEMMMTLAKLDQILIKIQFFESRQIDTVISNLYLDSAGETNTGQGQAAFVEECSCPQGYTGLSCESCASGFERTQIGPWLGQCKLPSKPENCSVGQYWARNRCERCPCPSFVETCTPDSYGIPVCQCPEGYAGTRCERCAPGYSGNPYVSGGCRRSLCNEAGSLSTVTDPSTGLCSCKQNTLGPYCNQCKPNTFYLSPLNVFGCIQCFCMGVTKDCVSSHLYRNQIISYFYRDSQDFKIGARYEVESNPSTSIIVDSNRQEIIFTSFVSGTPSAYYWSLPQKFLGNKITSYGGYLNYTFRYVPAPGSQSLRNNAPDVEIMSEDNSIRLYFFHRGSIEPNVQQTISVPIFEQYWHRNDGQPANREHLLMVLADLKAILIKASYSVSTTEAGLQNVILDVTEDRLTGLSHAYEVEECRCPVGYRGTSCEECDAGYHRVDHGLYLGICEPCNCNEHSRDCDPNTGACLNCANHTRGEHCELCEPGYSGNPTAGEPCKPVTIDCTCDLRGSLSPDCQNNVCSCKSNVIGNTCDTCKPGTFDLQASHRTGCLSCYCSGVSSQCQSSNLFVAQLPMNPLLDDNHGFTLTNANRERIIKTGFKLNLPENQITYDYTTERGQELFWSLPSTFTGNKITSYGGNLSWTQGYNAPIDALPGYGDDLVIYGDGISVHWNNNIAIAPNGNIPRTVQLVEHDFRRVTKDGTQRATRSDMLRVLSNIESILIRASFASQTSLVFIGDVSLDTATSHPLTSVRATHVENCRCPPGYKGSSCELCERGFYQVISQDGYVKECRRCSCNEHEESCSFDTYTRRVTCKCQPGYSGEYCERINDGIPPYPTTHPEPGLSPLPIIIVNISEPYIHVVAVGSTLRLTCTVTSSNPRPVRIVWSKFGESLPQGRAYDDGNGHFVILNAVASDSGTYICSATDQVTQEVKNVTVAVQDASVPKVSITPETTNGILEYKSGDVISINCDATGAPVPTVEWTREHGSVVGKNVTPGRNVLRIRPATKADSGTYICRARNSFGVDSKRITLFVQDRYAPGPDNEIRLVLTPPEFQGIAGDNVRLDCSIVGSSDGYSLSWSRFGAPSLPQNSEDRNGVLVIHAADTSVSGQYVCKAVSDRTNEVVAESSALVSVNPIPGDTKPPVISIDPESQLVPQGTLAVIRCNSPTDPTAAITWRKINEEMTAGVQILGSELRIPVTQVRDRGLYVCEIQNEGGLARASSTLEVDRREPPVISIYPQVSQMVEEGGNLFIQCQIVKGIPPPKIRWLRGNQRNFTPNVQEINGALRFMSVTAEDAGEYICTAENAAGHVDAVAKLDVISVPVISVSPAGPVNVAVGQPVRLECRASGKPTPSVEWQPLSGLRLSVDVDAPQSYVAGTAIFVINSAQLHDSGTYVCAASNVAGRTEERVQVIVSESFPLPPPTPEGVPLPPSTPGSSISPDAEMTFPRGSNAELRCEVASRDPIRTYWSRENNMPLNSNHDDSRPGILKIFRVTQFDAGKYFCTGISQNTGGTLFVRSVNLKIVAPPEITVEPLRQTVRPGDSPYVNCSATGEQPINIYWSSMNGNTLPRSVTFDRGLLQFRGITAYDAGRYLCRAQNYAGTAEAVAEVIVNDVSGPGIPVIKAADRYRTALENSNLELRCYVNATTPNYQITWTRERSELPQTSQTSGETLRLFGLKPEDSGQYKCKITSLYGENEDVIWLQVERTCLTNEFQCNDGTCISQSLFCDGVPHCADNSDEIDCHKSRRGLNNVTLSIIPQPSEVRVGGSVDLICHVEGDDRNTVTWSKVNGVLEPNAEAYGNTLRIGDVQLTNIGTYRCTIITKDGYRSIDHNLRIELPPTAITTTAVNEKVADYGQNIDLICEANLEPPMNYSWVIHSHDKSLRRIVPNTQRLTITNANTNHSGLYFCNVASGGTFVTIPQVLVVDKVIPAFDRSSYIALPPLTQATVRFDIEINFKPTNSDGLLLFNSESRDVKKDFVSLILQNGYPVFSFNVGSGPAVIRGDIPLQTNRWHNIRLMRHMRNGTMEVNGVKSTGVSPGKFETLDLQLPLYIGGHNNYAFVEQVADINVGFQGCINRLRIDSKEVNLREDATESVSVQSCHNCARNPCLNNGFCQETSSSNGYMCICLPGYSGEICELRKMTCYLDSCGSGQCLENDYGIECLCNFGKGGKNCREDIKIHVPAFTKNSYLAYLPSLLNEKMKLLLKVKPMGGGNSIENGLILLMTKGENGADFIALYTLDNYIQLKFRIKGQIVSLQSNRFLVPGEYVTVSLTIDSSEVQFGVANESIIAQEFNPTNEISDFKWHSTMYIGGYDKRTIDLPEDLPVKTGFYGCISSMEILGIDTALLRSYTEAINIDDCYSRFGDACEATSPCKNGGSCYTTRDTYKCDCPSGFSGSNCERYQDACELQRPCKNGGTCSSTGNTYKCSCPLGFGGVHCGSEVILDQSVAFHGNGFIELSEVTTFNSKSIDTIEITFRTSSHNGLLFWRGRNDAQTEYVAIAIRNGFVQLAFRTLGSAKTISASNHRVDDNASHRIVIRYSQEMPKKISLNLDGLSTDVIDSAEPLEARGNIFAGGLPNFREITGNLYTEGFEGCISDFRINNYPADFSQAVSGVNVATCTGS